MIPSLALTLVLLGAPPSGTLLDPDLVERHVLPNGIVLLTLEDHSIPVVAWGIGYRVGSRNERPGITGISHLFEHMMFNGAKRYGRKQFDAVLEAAGGYSNAFTTADLTYYNIVLPADRLELAVDLESDRMESLEITDEVLQAEREVVKDERLRATENNPASDMDELLQALAYLAHPYRWPVVGWRGDLDAISTPDLVAYFRTYYTPSNAVIMVSGDFDTAGARKLVERWFAAIPAGTPPPPVVNAEPVPRGERRATLRRDAELPAVEIGWRAPAIGSPDLYALDVIQTLLAGGDSSRLYQRLVDRERTAATVVSWYEWRLGPGLFTVYAQGVPGADTARIEASILEEIARLAREEIPESELRKARRILTADFYRRLRTNDGRAEAIACAEIQFGDYRKLYETPARYEEVTTARAKEAAARWLTDLGRATVVLVPTEAKP